jgi:hypothetical protein
VEVFAYGLTNAPNTAGPLSAIVSLVGEKDERITQAIEKVLRKLREEN